MEALYYEIFLFHKDNNFSNTSYKNLKKKIRSMDIFKELTFKETSTTTTNFRRKDFNYIYGILELFNVVYITLLCIYFVLRFSIYTRPHKLHSFYRYRAKIKAVCLSERPLAKQVTASDTSRVTRKVSKYL